MAGKIFQTSVGGLERIDAALDALVRFLEKKPTITGVNVLSCRVLKEIRFDQMRHMMYLNEQSIRNSDQLTIEHLERKLKSRHTKLIHLEHKLTSIMTTCREMFKSQTFTTIKQCYSKLTELKHLYECLTKSLNRMSQRTELHHLERGVKKRVSKQTGQQSSNHEQWINTESKNSMISAHSGIQHFGEKMECRCLQMIQMEEHFNTRKNEMEDEIYDLKNKLKDKDSQLLKTCGQLNLALYRLKTTETERSETIISLKRKILGTAVDIESRDKMIEELRNIIYSVRTEMTTANELLRKKIETQEEQLLRQASNQLNDFETDQNKTLKSLKKENQEKGHHISKLSYQLKQALNTIDNKNGEIRQIDISLKERIEEKGERVRHFEELLNKDKAKMDQMTERINILDIIMHKKQSQLHELHEQLDRNLERLRQTETESDEIKTSLEQKIQNLIADIKLRNQHVKDLEEKLANNMTEKDAERERLEQNIIDKMTQNSDRNTLLEIELKERDEQSGQRDHTLEKLQTSKDDLLGTLADLQKKNRELELELGLKGKDLEKVLYRMAQLKDETTLLVNRLEESERDQREQFKQANNKFHERGVEMNNIIISLKKEQEEKNQLELELKEEQKQTLKRMNQKDNMTEINTALNRKLKDFEAEMGRRQQEVKHLDTLLYYRKTEVTKLSERNEFLQKKLKEMDERLREPNEQQRIKIKYLQKEVEHRDRKISDLEEMLQRIQEENKENIQYKHVKGKDEKISDLTDQLDQTSRKLHDTEIVLDDAKTSKAMGDRLSDNNPHITDLSDRNRPTKLAERCAELYDNQWTDAFDNLDRYFDREETVIETLLWILQDAMTFCKTRARTQMEELGRELTFAEQHVQANGDMLADVCKLFNDCKRVMAPVAVGNLYKRYVSHLERSTDKTLRSALEVRSYTSECLEICWLMVIHDPPVVFAPEARKGSSFDTDLYKPYTTSGTHIDYVVWPPVLLHEGGPILAKGVAQGYSNV